MRTAGLFLAVLIMITGLASTPIGRHVDHAAAFWTAHLSGIARPDLMVVWVIGAPLAAVILLVVFTADPVYSWRQRLTAWGLMGLGSVVELILKHFGVGGSISGLAVPAMPHFAPRLAALERHLSIPIPTRWTDTVTHLTLRGTFPSGHVLRLTLAAGYALARPGWVLPAVVAAAAGFCVVATGGHTATDALGGAALAGALLVAAGRLWGRSRANPR